MDHALLIERIRALSRPLAPLPTGLTASSEPLAGMQAVLFDIYGTLLISASGEVGTAGEAEEALAARRAMLRDALADAGFSGSLNRAAGEIASSLSDAIRGAQEAERVKGTAWPEVEIREVWRSLLDRCAGRGLLEKGIDDAAVERFAIEYECRANPTAPMPGAAAALSLLRARGLPLGIVSNAQFYTPLVLEACLGASPEALGFEESLVSWSFRMRSAKPDPRLFDPVLSALRSRGIPPEACVYIGNDRRNDIAAAAARGLRTILFAGDVRALRLREGDPAAGSARPDRVLLSFDNLPALLA